MKYVLSVNVARSLRGEELSPVIGRDSNLSKILYFNSTQKLFNMFSHSSMGLLTIISKKCLNQLLVIND